MEIIVVILIITIITTFTLTKFNQINDKTHLITLKSQVALIQNGISKKKSKNILLGQIEDISSLDNASINLSNEELFNKVIDFSIISTNTSEKKLGNWAKTSSNRYIFYTSTNPIIFALENNSFICKSAENICKEIN